MAKGFGSPHVKATKVGDKLDITLMSGIVGGVRPVGNEKVDRHDPAAIRECVIRLIEIARAAQA